METQEFDEELQETNRIYKEIGDLNTKELLELQGAINQIKENSQKEKKENMLSWLEQSVISVLKDFSTASCNDITLLATIKPPLFIFAVKRPACSPQTGLNCF